MNRLEALAVLHEIDKECKDSIIATCLSLDSPDTNLIEKDKRYKIRMKCHLNDYALQCLTLILKRNGLILKENDGYVIIHKS